MEGSKPSDLLAKRGALREGLCRPYGMMYLITAKILRCEFATVEIFDSITQQNCNAQLEIIDSFVQFRLRCATEITLPL